MSKVGQKSLEEVCRDCLYNSSNKGDDKMEKELTREQEVKKGMINQSYLVHSINPWEKIEQPIDWVKSIKEAKVISRTHQMHKAEVKFSDVLCQMEKTFVNKNNDYGNSFKELFEEFGMTSSIIRLQDKLSRLKALQKVEQKVSDESQLDTLLDMANYAIMTYVELKNRR